MNADERAKGAFIGHLAFVVSILGKVSVSLNHIIIFVSTQRIKGEIGTPIAPLALLVRLVEKLWVLNPFLDTVGVFRRILN